MHCHLPTGNCGLNATLDVPADTAVDLTTGGGNMQVSGIQRNVTLDSAGGDVTLSSIDGNTDLSTGGGNLNAGDLGGILNFTTGGGDVNVNDLFSPHVKLESGGGNVTLMFTEVPDVPRHHQQRGRHHRPAPARHDHPVRHHVPDRGRRLQRLGADQPGGRPTRSSGQRRRQRQHRRSQLTRGPDQLTRSERRNVATFRVPRLAGTET